MNIKSDTKRKIQLLNFFTMTELMIVIGIIMVLVALLFPALQLAKETARTAACASNMRQLGVAIGIYASTNKSELPWTQHTPDHNGRFVTSDWESEIFDNLGSEMNGKDVYQQQEIAKSDKYAYYRCPSDKEIGTSRSYALVGSPTAADPSNPFKKYLGSRPYRIGAYARKPIYIPAKNGWSGGIPPEIDRPFCGYKKWGGFDTPYQNFLLCEAACIQVNTQAVGSGFGDGNFAVVTANSHIANGGGAKYFGILDSGPWAHKKKLGSNYLYLDLHCEFIEKPAKPFDTDKYDPPLSDFSDHTSTWNQWVTGFDARDRKVKNIKGNNTPDLDP